MLHVFEHRFVFKPSVMSSNNWFSFEKILAIAVQ